MYDVNGCKSVFVCGAGHQGLSMAAHLAISGIRVNLWNRSFENIKEISKNKKIFCEGVVNGFGVIDCISSNISDVISDFVMVTTPSSAHCDIAEVLAPYVHKDMIIVLNPGRTFGAIDFCKNLIKYGAKEIPHIAETQTIVYTCRKSSPNSVKIFALKDDVKIAALRGSDVNYIMEKMPWCLRPYFSIADSIGYTSLSNVGMILHCAPVMMNIGWIETEKVDFKYYYDGISESVSKFLEKLDYERICVASGLGIDIESVSEWLKRTYKIDGDSLYECIRNNKSYAEIDAPTTIYCRYILEDIPNGLVPVEYLGKCLNIPTPNISTIIDLASSVTNIDYRKNGRKFDISTLKMYL